MLNCWNNEPFAKFGKRLVYWASLWKSCGFGDVAPDSPLRGYVGAEPLRPRASARGYTRPQLRCSIRKACSWRLAVTHANRSFAALFKNHDTARMRHSHWFYWPSLVQKNRFPGAVAVRSKWRRGQGLCWAMVRAGRPRSRVESHGQSSADPNFAKGPQYCPVKDLSYSCKYQ